MRITRSPVFDPVDPPPDSRGGRLGRNHCWLAMGWFELPRIVVNDRYGEFLVVSGRLDGTGHVIEDRVFMASMAAIWHRIAAD